MFHLHYKGVTLMRESGQENTTFWGASKQGTGMLVEALWFDALLLGLSVLIETFSAIATKTRANSFKSDQPPNCGVTSKSLNMTTTTTGGRIAKHVRLRV